MAFNNCTNEPEISTNKSGISEPLPLNCRRVGMGLSWDTIAGKPIDLDLQAIAFDESGRLLNAVYYNNLKAFGRALTHSSDEVTGVKTGLDECVWADLEKLPENVALIVFVVACYTGGCHLQDVKNGLFHVLEESLDKEVLRFPLEQSDEEVDLVAAMERTKDGWFFRQIQVPAQDGQHFIDILEPTIGNFVRSCIPGAPKRIKAAFAMEKGSVVDLPRTAEIKSIKACLGWDAAKDAAVDLDVSAVLLDRSGVDLKTVFFGNLKEQGVEHSGDNVTGKGDGDDEIISVNLEQVAPEVESIFFVINVYTRKMSFAQVANSYCRVLTADGEEFCKFMLTEAGKESGLIMARLMREPGGQRWGFQAIGMPSRGQMWKDSLPDLKKYAGAKPHMLQATRTFNLADSEVVTAKVVSGVAFAPAPRGRASQSDSMKLTVVSAQGLRAADWNGLSDPYCICEYPGAVPGTTQKVQTKTLMFTLEPKWNETFKLDGVPSEGQLFKFTLMDYDMGRSDDVLGTAELTADRLSNGKFEGDLDVFYSKGGGFGGKLSGSLRIKVERC